MKIIMLLALLVCFPVVSFSEVMQIVVPVTFAHEGRSVTASLSIDTGASTTTISPGLATRLGVQNSACSNGFAEMADGRRVALCRVLMDVSAGDHVRKDLRVNIMDYTAERGVDGWLGMNFLSDMTMTIDWKNKRIYWSE